MLRSWRWTLMLAAGIGCQPAFGRLEGVLVDVEPEARPAETGELGRVEVTREGRQEQGRPNMPLKKGDGIITGADGIGIMVLAGYQVIMDPGTDLTIENPSIFVRIGRIIVKKIEEVAEAFTVNTEFGAAAVEGTEFIFEVNRQNVVELTVLEGRVKVFPRGSARWQDTVAYVAGERGRLDAARAARLTRLTPRVTDSLRRRIKHLEITLRPEVPDVMGLPGGEAEAELKRHGLVPLVIPVITRQAQPALRRALGQVPRVGTVVATDPPVGSRLRQGGRVRISVEQESVAVPDLMGQPYATAVQVLARAGLGVGDTTSSVQPNGVDGTVSGMGPSPGAFVAPGTRVSLTILRVAPVVERAGPVDRRVIEVVQCTVPKLGGLTEDQAKAALEQNGLKPGQISFGGGSTVTIQEPVPDTKVKCGSPVSFMVGSPIR